jgi:hypothetical protein
VCCGIVEALIKQELQRIVVCPHHKAARQEVRAHVAHRLYKLDELPLIGDQHGVLRCDGVAIQGKGAVFS